ncbi:uncharacterized protein LOC114311595 [Camellia sinensis]|uniref:uncharacterized protein LOC114311595 n=1 Tax=Camellia sinensis TaxID=4442 RepID=UPI0010361CE7|nr:uncharacterized protein LOC114311595 [Camellia sinensis]
MKTDIFKFMQEFYQHIKLVKELNSSFITLIPKKESPNGLTDYRPISLVGVVYKILAKVLSRRLKQVLPNVISEVEMAFLGGRNIFDGVMIANEDLQFREAEWEEIINVKRILRCFEVMSGLKINFHKSVVCGVGVSDMMVHDFASTLHCLSQKLPLKYLGLPLGANLRRKKAWQTMVDKVKSRLAMWKMKLLSFVGRLTLVKSVLDSIPGYYISLFNLPIGIAKEIDKLKSAFLWGSSELRRKIHMVKWNDVSMNKDQGGSGIRKTRDTNACMLLKWW